MFPVIEDNLNVLITLRRGVTIFCENNEHDYWNMLRKAKWQKLGKKKEKRIKSEYYDPGIIISFYIHWTLIFQNLHVNVILITMHYSCPLVKNLKNIFERFNVS